MEGTNIQPGGGRRLVLGFDAGCATCSELARRVKETIGDRLEIRSLNDPQVEHWRKQSLGEGAPWAPTLVEIAGGQTKAWTGPWLGVRLSLRLGPAMTWRVLQILGENNADGTNSLTGDHEVVSANRGGITRSRFIKGAVGAAAAVSVLSGAGAFASPVTTGRSGIPESAGRRDFKGEELNRIARSVAERKDIINIMDSSWLRKVRAGRVTQARVGGHDVDVIANGGNPSVRMTGGGVSVSGNGMIVKAAKHDLRGGNGLLAVAYMSDNRLVSYYEFDEPVDGVKSKAQVWEFREGKDEIALRKGSHNGVSDDPVPSSESKSSLDAKIYCGGCKSRKRRWKTYLCKNVSWRCFAISCGTCIVAGGGVLSLVCVYVYCPYLLYCGTGTCCKQGGCKAACAGCVRR